MPLLPSGRLVGIQRLVPDDIIKKFSSSHPEASLITLGMEVELIDTMPIRLLAKTIKQC
jgi:hypothetical protein